MSDEDNDSGGGGGYSSVNLGKTWKTDKTWAPLISVAFQKIIDNLATAEKIQVTGLVDVKDTNTQVSGPFHNE